MKKLLIAFLLLPTLSFAQKVQLGFNAGANYCTTPVSNGTTLNGQGKPGVTAALKIGFNVSRWQLGAAIEAGSQNAEVTPDVYILALSSSSLHLIDYTPPVYQIRNQYITPYFFANGRFAKFKAGNLYAGFMIGVAANRSREGFANTPYQRGDNGAGIITGGQFGLQINTGKHFSLNAETGVRYASFFKHYNQIIGEDYIVPERTNKASYFQTPLTLGVGYTF